MVSIAWGANARRLAEITAGILMWVAGWGLCDIAIEYVPEKRRVYVYLAMFITLAILVLLVGSVSIAHD